MLTPKDIELWDVDFGAIEAEIDKSIKSFHGWYSFECAIVDNEYPIEVRNAIAQKYVAGGWNYVYHRTSSENKERPGLTQFFFSTKKLDDYMVKGFHKVSATIPKEED